MRFEVKVNYIIFILMGNSLKDSKSKIIIVGLDNAGKSTLINRM